MKKVDVYLNVGVKKHRFETGSMKWYKEFYSKHPQLHVVKNYQEQIFIKHSQWWLSLYVFLYFTFGFVKPQSCFTWRQGGYCT